MVKIEVPEELIVIVRSALRRAADEFHGALRRPDAEPDDPLRDAWAFRAKWLDAAADQLMIDLQNSTSK